MRVFFYKLIRNIIIGLSCVIIQGASFALPSIEGIQIYQKNTPLSSERKLKLASDIDRYRTADNLWDVLRKGFTLEREEQSPAVLQEIRGFLNDQDLITRSSTRAAPYLYFILQQAKKRHLPIEVVLLPMIESAYNPFAYSSAGAAGLWQMMPDTASGFGIKHDWWYDGRRDVVASTRAALDYLSYLGNFFNGNWLLAIAAYDTGEGNVLSAIRKNIREGKSTDFWSLPLSQETKHYVPRLLAFATIIAHPERYSIKFPNVPNAPYLAQVDIGGQVDLNHAASLAGISFNALKQLNPGYNHNTTDPNGPYRLILPIENVEQFTENLERSPLYHQITWVRYKVKSGDTITTIAKHFNVSPSVLLKANPTLLSKLKAGNHVLIPKTTPTLSKETAFLAYKEGKVEAKVTQQEETQINLPANNSSDNQYVLQPGDTVYLTRKGDTPQKIAKRFHVNRQTLLSLNPTLTDKLTVGKKIIIPTHRSVTLAPGDTVYMVRKGDTVEAIAQKFHVLASAIRLHNLMTTNSVQEGDRLVIPTKKL